MKSDLLPLIDALPFAALALDAGGHIVCANSAWNQLAGHVAGDLAGRTFFDEYARIDNAAEIETAFSDHAARGGLAHRFAIRILAAGDSIPVRLHLRSMTLGSGPHVLALLEPLVLDEPIDDAQRLDVLEQEIARIKHEMSNPLMGLLGCAELLDEDETLPGEYRHKVQTIRSEARRIRDRLDELSRLRLR